MERVDPRPNILIAAPDAVAARVLEDGLQKAGLRCPIRRAESMNSFAAALDESNPDLVLVSWKMRDFDGLAALALCHEHSPQSAVIVVSDKLDGATAAEIAKAGAEDVITNSSLDWLGFAAWHALESVAERRKRQQFEEELEGRVAIVAAERNVAPHGILVVDRRGGIVSLNQRFIDMWKIPKDIVASLSNRRLVDVMLSKIVEPKSHVENIRLLYTRKDMSLREQITLKDGRAFDCFTAPLLRDADGGEYLGRAWFYYDATESRNAESKEREQQALFRDLAEQELASIGIFRKDGTVVYINAKLASVLGYLPNEIIGRNFLKCTTEGERKATLAMFREVATGKRHSAQVRSKVLAKNGDIVDLLGQFTSTVYDGKVAVIGIALDVTELSRAEAALNENQELYRAVVLAMADGVIVEDSDGSIVTCNGSAARILGSTVEELIGRKTADPAWQFVGAEGTPMEPDQLPPARAFRTGKAQRDVLVGITRADGVPIWITVNVEPLFRPEGTVPHAVVVSFSDTTAHKLARDSLVRVNRALTVLTRAIEVMVRATSEQQLLDRMCEVLVETGGYRLAWIGFAERRPAVAVRSMAKAFGGGEAAGSRTDAEWDALLTDPTTTEVVLRLGRPSVSQNGAMAEAGKVRADAGGSPLEDARVLLPLSEGGVTFGILTLYAPAGSVFTPDEMKLLVELAEDFSYGIVALRERVMREDSEKHLRRAMEEAVQAIASTLEMRDPYTAGHQRDVARLAVAMADEMGLPEDEIKGIYLAAIVHDIGKIRIPIDILSKPGPLTQLEYELIQTHAQTGHDIIKNVDFPWPVAQMILQHHERLDGSGYPAGLKGNEILQGAKILAVADVVQAMSRHRPYRAAFGERAALAEIERGRGRLYDSASVDACLKLFREKGFKFE